MSEKDLINSNHFCILPFVHSCIWTDGRVIPCCINHDIVFGVSKVHPLKKIYSDKNEKLINFRKELLTGPELPKSCHRCSKVEKLGTQSLRQFYNKKFNHLLPKLDIDENNILKKERISYWDVRFSNLCNLKCRSCDGINSSKIAEEKYSVTKIPTEIMLKAFDKSDDFFDFFKEHLDTLEDNVFCGGETLLLEEHYSLLDLLIENEKFNVEMRYFSNCTRLDFKGKNLVYDYWPRFTNVKIHASIDAGWEQLHYIRHGAKWQTVFKNLLLIREKCPHINIILTPTVQIYNAFHVPKLHKELIKHKILSCNDFNPIILNDPLHFSLTSLPLEKKRDVEKHWNEHKQFLISLNAKKTTLNTIDDVITYMYSKDTSYTLPTLKKENDRFDKLRNENFLETFPEYKDLLN